MFLFYLNWCASAICSVREMTAEGLRNTVIWCFGSCFTLSLKILENNNFPFIPHFIMWCRPFSLKQFGISQLSKRGDILATAAERRLILLRTEQDQAHPENSKTQKWVLKCISPLIHAFAFSACADWDRHIFINSNPLLQTLLKIDCSKVTNSHLNDSVSTKLKTRAKRTLRNTIRLFKGCNGGCTLLT